MRRPVMRTESEPRPQGADARCLRRAECLRFFLLITYMNSSILFL